MIKGMSDITKNLAAEIEKIENASDQGLLAAGNLVIGRSQSYTPVDEGNLRANQDAQLEGAGTVSLNVRSNYAVYVHENVGERLRGVPRDQFGARGNYWDGGRSKFLETAMDESRTDIIKTVQKFARVE